MQPQELIPHLFRSEFSKLTAVLCRHMGIGHMEAAEDIVSETFLSALENWSYKGLPPNPVAWLYTVAKNKCRNYIQRNQLFNIKIAQELRSQSADSNETDIDLSEQNITDSQLRMLFVICHPSIAPEAQIGLSLRILCGFGIEEIANAFLVNRETINKRLYRAKEKLKAENVSIELPIPAAINERLDNVLTTLYLLFNEGYYSESHDSILREDLCLEAMKLVYLLLQNEQTNQPKVHALLSLMCFHSSRFAARKNQQGEIVLYHDQDESRWNYELIAKGAFHLKQASQGDQFSKYHLEAGIAYWHTIKTDNSEKWENILQLYNQLLRLEYSPVAALNRTYALSKVYGKQVAINEAEKLQLNNNHYYFILLGELYCDINNDRASFNFEKAFEMAKNQTDRQIIKKRLDELQQGNLPTHCQ
ncbi:MAG TPA: sigma-70 family RNA polymerase sigma factor [Chitinophagaceae bacterium]